MLFVPIVTALHNGCLNCTCLSMWTVVRNCTMHVLISGGTKFALLSTTNIAYSMHLQPYLCHVYVVSVFSHVCCSDWSPL